MNKNGYLLCTITALYQKWKDIELSESRSQTYSKMDFPANRNTVVDLLAEGMMRHIVHAIIEVDVTEPREFLAKIKATKGETLSFTAFLLHCLGKAVDENKIMHAYRSGRHQLVLFNDVDAATIIEREVESRKLPISHIIRSINKKSVKELHDEIRDAQVQKLGDSPLTKRTNSIIVYPDSYARFFGGESGIFLRFTKNMLERWD